VTSDLDHALGPPPPTEEELDGPARIQFIERTAPLVDLLDEEGALEDLGGQQQPGQ
jgi:hypothetical protein